MRRLLVLILLLLASAPAGAEQWALVIGVDRYDNTDVTPLQYAGADAKAFARTLRETVGVPADRIVLMTSDSAGKERPSSVNVLGWLEGMKRSVKPGDDFVFYFAGHGIVQDGESYLLTVDANLGSSALVRRSALSVKEVQAALKELKARRVLQLVDACRNDPRGGRATGPDNVLSSAMTRDIALKARAKAQPGEMELAATLFACRVGQRSFEGYNGHGYFTYFLVQGLRGEAAGADGAVTLTSLVDYLERKVSDAVRLREHGKEQSPWADVSGSGASRWLLSKGAAAPTVAVWAPAALTPETSPGLWTARFDTKWGMVSVRLPDDVTPGDAVQGSVLYQVRGESDEELRANAEALRGVKVRIAGQEVSGAFAVKLAAALIAPSVELHAPGASGSASTPLHLASKTRAQSLGGALWKLPSVGQQGRAVVVVGNFSGPARVLIGGQEAEPIAASPRQLVVTVPRGAAGPTHIVLETGGKQVKGSLQRVAVKLNAPRLALSKDEKVDVTATVEGLSGLPPGAFPLRLRVTIGEPRTVRFDGADTPTRDIEIKSADQNTVSIPLIGTTNGPFTVTATVIP